MRAITCARGHRMVPVVEGLYLCECSSYGRLTDLKGAVDEGRAMLERGGGLEHIRQQMLDAEEDARKKRKLGRGDRREAELKGMKHG